jgi:hypothetical protein
MEAVRTSETSVDNHFTRQYIPEHNSDHPWSSSLMMEAVRTSETSVDNHFTRQYISEHNSDHPWWWRQYEPLKRRSTIILHGSISQNTTLIIPDDGGSTYLWNVGRQSFTRQYIPEHNSDHPWWWRQYAPLKRRSTIILHGSISQNTTLIIPDHHPWWWRQYAPLKRRSTIIFHGSTSQNTTLNIILAAVRTWNLT